MLVVLSTISLEYVGKWYIQICAAVSYPLQADRLYGCSVAWLDVSIASDFRYDDVSCDSYRTCIRFRYQPIVVDTLTGDLHWKSLRYKWLICYWAANPARGENISIGKLKTSTTPTYPYTGRSKVNGYNAQDKWPPEFLGNVILTDAVLDGNHELIATQKSHQFGWI